jgi:hypothetical protein
VGDKGFYFEPTIFEVYNTKAKIAQEEIFGPVQCVFKWSDLNEVSSVGIPDKLSCMLLVQVGLLSVHTLHGLLGWHAAESLAIRLTTSRA